MKFNFKLEVEGKDFTFEAERIYRSKQFERFKITAVGTGQYLIIQSNRPLIEAKKNDKQVIWHKIEGFLSDARALRMLYDEIETAIKTPPPPFQGTLNL